MTASGTLKAITAPDAYAEQARGVVETAVRSVIDEAEARGVVLPPHLASYIPQHGAARALGKLRPLFLQLYQDTVRRVRGE